MKNLFNLLLILMCGISFIIAMMATNTEAFVYATSALFLSAIVFLINAAMPLIKE